MLLTFAVFRAVLERAKCSCACMSPAGDLIDTDGTPTPALYLFERDDNGVHRHALVYIYEESLPVGYSIIRSTCAALKLDEAIFGSHH